MMLVLQTEYRLLTHSTCVRICILSNLLVPHSPQSSTTDTKASPGWVTHAYIYDLAKKAKDMPTSLHAVAYDVACTH